MPRFFPPRVTVLALLVASGCGSGGSDGGPVEASDAYELYSQTIDPGQDLSVGTVRLFLAEGDEPAAIEAVRLVGVRGSMELLGVRTRRLPVTGNNFLADFGFPPKGFADTVPLAEQNVVPVPSSDERRTRRGLMLVIGVRTGGQGVTAARAVEITYRVGAARYTEEVEQPLYLCAPADDYSAGCPPEDAEDRFGDGVLE